MSAPLDVVTGMLHGRRRHLHEGGQIAIATWANLKALVAQMGFRQPEGQVPREHYREVHRWAADEQPPPLTTVYTAKAGWSMGVAQPGFFRLNGINKGGDPGDKDNGYIAAFSALDLVVVVVRLLWDERAEFNFSPRLAPSVRRIWPPTDSFIWPPGPALTDAGIAALAGGPQGPDA